MQNFTKFNTSIVNLINSDPSILFGKTALNSAITNCYVQFEAIHHGSKKDKAEMRMYLQGLLDGAMLQVMAPSGLGNGSLHSLALCEFKECVVDYMLQASFGDNDTSKFRS